MDKSEHDIEKNLVNMVKTHGGLCLKWVCPGWSGVPDRILLFPGGRILFVELKRPKNGRVASLQKWWRRKLQAFGFACMIVKNQADINLLEHTIIENIKA